MHILYTQKKVLKTEQIIKLIVPLIMVQCLPVKYVKDFMSLWETVDFITRLNHKVWLSGVTLVWGQGLDDTKAFTCLQYITTEKSITNTNIHTFTACRPVMECKPTDVHTYTQGISGELIQYGKLLIQSWLGPCKAPESVHGPEDTKPMTGKKAFTKVKRRHKKWKKNNNNNKIHNSLGYGSLSHNFQDFPNHCSQGTTCRRYCVRSTEIWPLFLSISYFLSCTLCVPRVFGPVRTQTLLFQSSHNSNLHLPNFSRPHPPSALHNIQIWKFLIGASNMAHNLTWRATVGL